MLDNVYQCWETVWQADVKPPRLFLKTSGFSVEVNDGGNLFHSLAVLGKKELKYTLLVMCTCLKR